MNAEGAGEGIDHPLDTGTHVRFESAGLEFEGVITEADWSVLDPNGHNWYMVEETTLGAPWRINMDAVQEVLQNE